MTPEEAVDDLVNAAKSLDRVRDSVVKATREYWFNAARARVLAMMQPAATGVAALEKLWAKVGSPPFASQVPGDMTLRRGWVDSCFEEAIAAAQQDPADTAASALVRICERKSGKMCAWFSIEGTNQRFEEPR